MKKPDKIIPHFRKLLKNSRTAGKATKVMGEAGRRNPRKLMPYIDRLMHDKDQKVKMNAIRAFEGYVTTDQKARKYAEKYYLEKHRQRRKQLRKH